MKHLITFTLLGIPLLSAGCKTFHPAIYNNPDGLNGFTVLIVPFSELRRNLWYDESSRGQLIQRVMERWISENWAADFPDSHDKKDIVGQVVDWPTDRITSKDWKKLCEGLSIDYVVVGDIFEVQMRNPSEINLLRPTAKVRYRIIDVKRGREAYSQETSASVGGYEDELQIPTLDLGGNTENQEKILLVSLGQKIAKELYGYYSDW